MCKINAVICFVHFFNKIFQFLTKKITQQQQERAINAFAQARQLDVSHLHSSFNKRQKLNKRKSSICFRSIVQLKIPKCLRKVNFFIS